MIGQARISSVYKMGQTAQDLDPLATYARIEHLRRKAWLQAGVISIVPGELPAQLSAEIKAWAEDRYGQR